MQSSRGMPTVGRPRLASLLTPPYPYGPTPHGPTPNMQDSTVRRAVLAMNVGRKTTRPNCISHL